MLASQTLLKTGLTSSNTIGDEKYRTYDLAEIASILNGLVHEKTLITAYFNQGRDLLLTTILKLDPENKYLILDYGKDEEISELFLKSGIINFITTKDKIKIQFSAHRVERVKFENQLVFKIALPDNVLRFQRRDYYRLATPTTTPIKCSIPFPSRGKIDVALLDISVGGISMFVYQDEATFEVGAIYPDCRITLPDVGTVVVTLQIKNTNEVIMRNGSKHKRSGCQFVDLSAPTITMIERYVMKQERERNAQGILKN